MKTVPFIPENAPFRPDQRLWLNGYLAGLCATVAVPGEGGEAALPPPSLPLAILYGSQTGTAEALAKKIGREAKGRGWAPEVVAADDHAKIDWTRQSRLLVVMSTYGDGEMPDNAQAFWTWLQTEGAAAALAHLDYAVLALGDTNYPEFCAAGKKIDDRLAVLGAKRLHARADCDADYEGKAREWIGGAFAVLGSPSSPAAEAPGEPAQDEAGWSKSRPFPARLVANRKLNAEGSGKETRHVEISLAGSGLAYEAGDALGVLPSNCPALVDDLLALLGLAGDAALRETLRTGYDITKPSADLLAKAGETNAELRDLLAPERKEALRDWLWGREVYDLLAATPALRPDAAGLLALLKKMAPRLYSISSSPKAHLEKDGTVHLTVGVVRHHSHGRARKGVCSTFLADLAGESVPVFVQTSHGFRPPADGAVPVIMVGPGTGIAPFRAFLHERLATGAKGKNWLFFGDQRAATDFYYRDELEAMQASGHLTRLSTAFSRDQEEKIYVQTRMAEEAAALWAWLQEGAHFYVCGDASRMAKDVDAALHQVAERAGGMTPEAAAAYVRSLKETKRYQRDVY
ncbi:NAD(P)H-dependent nitrite reductase flavoprotein subunit [Verrucomicrobium sp. GAS474]|uniref:sulfite reductase subunit alpha n=1 Tax=Verrucomicrobium sp. GAS474 TaxID=1882831 RepID=UPI000879712A|nr:sulfite reductase subunit alpha [Verrucomicrobium sp. GAS474]SDT95401.1 NAD(P)H-dependent nitrite reductase flavoprotein subunit [Verrucomicrobium sp. GAS474]